MSGIALRNITVGGLLREAAVKYPDNKAIVCDGFEMTYRELDAAVDRIARRLITLGIEKGDHIGVLCETSPREIMLKYALVRIGAVACLLNTGLQRGDLEDIFKRSDIIKIVFVGNSYKDVDYYALCTDVCSRMEHPIEVRHFEHPKSVEYAPEEVLHRMEAAVKPEDPAFILYTSGTTGPAKAVVDSHYSRANLGIKQAEDMGLTQEDRFLVALPTFHCFSLSVNIMASCAVGGCMCIPKSRRTQVLLETIEKYQCTVFSCVPTLYHAILARPDFPTRNVSSIRVGIIGGSLCPPELFASIEKGFGMTLVSSLGQTETGGGITVSELTDSLEVRAATVGHFMEFVDGKIVNPQTGEECPTGVAGEICCKGYNVMLGYYKNPEATAKAIDKDGWLHTGDLGWLDETGYLHLSGRLKDLIIRSGENISPFEIETLFDKDPRISSTKAIGIPDPHYGEEICLCVELSGKERPDAEELRYIVSRNLAEYKVPKYVVFFDSFPKNTTGKVLTNELKKEAFEKLGIN